MMNTAYNKTLFTVMYQNLKNIVVIGLLLMQYSIVLGQVEKEHLKPLLSLKDQKTIEKIDVLNLKGKNIENEANILLASGNSDKEKAKAEKKYTLKRLEAAEYYQKANALFIDLMKDDISNFRKKNKSLQVLSSVKNKEDRAGELQRNARSLRKMAEDLLYPAEKLVKVIEAEHLEKEACSTYLKVLYAYLNQPLAYDMLKSEPQTAEKAVSPPADTIPAKRTPALPAQEPMAVKAEQQFQANTPPVAETAEEKKSAPPVVIPVTAATTESVNEIKPVASIAVPPQGDLKVNEGSKEPEKKTTVEVITANKTAAELKNEISSSEVSPVFKVQIVASKVPLSKSGIQKIYSGQYPVEEAIESGWYKYSVVTGSEFSKAKAFMEKEKIPGAFIKAYLGNTRIDIKEALSLKNN